MNLSLAIATLALSAQTSIAVLRNGALSTDVFIPTKISYLALVDDSSFTESIKKSMMAALQESGMVSITDIPGKQVKDKALSWDLQACLQDSEAAKEHTFQDGTVRRTLATHTVPGGAQNIDHRSESPSCEAFSKAVDDFRSSSAQATQAFAKRLESLLEESEDVHQDGALLSTAEGYEFSAFSDVVENGEHLEHFHSYQKNSNQASEETVAYHTDQGLFIAFTPGRMVRDQPGHVEISTGFFIELPSGARVHVKFDENDDLVFMLGDGVNQYVNPMLLDKTHAAVTLLRATPHALTMPEHSKNVARVWYGRMVLPPASALHPKHGKSFGLLREEMIDASINNNNEHALSFGCSSSSMTARQLEETSCEEGTLLCWHRCMDIAEAGVSQEICAAQSLDLQCINPRGQLWDNTHGDFFPGCADANSTELNTPYPSLPGIPRDNGTCSTEEWDAFVSSANFNNSFEVGRNGIFMWDILESGQINGRLAYNGLLGYLAFGFANVGGSKNGMHGATILLAIPGDNYTATDGFELDAGPSVQEFVISPDPAESSFRFWMDPVNDFVATARQSSEIDSRSVESTECFTALTFQATSINGIPFNLEGTDELIWAANGQDFFAGYHGPDDRSRFSIDWSTGEALANTGETAPPPTEEGDPVETSSGSFYASKTGIALVAALASIADFV
jgi:hypothetical protein